LSFDLSLFRNKSANDIHETILDTEFTQLIESKRVIHLDLDKFVLDAFDKLEALTSTLISNIDSAYLQQTVDLAALIATASQISSQSSLIVNPPSFTTTSSIVQAMPLLQHMHYAFTTCNFLT